MQEVAIRREAPAASNEEAFSKVHPRYRTPATATWIAGFAVGIPAMIGDIGAFADLANMGTLCAFAMVSAGVLVLRKQQPERPRGFRVPWVPVVPILAIACCLLLMLSLPLFTWLNFLGWLTLGLLIYFGYSKSRSLLRKTE